VHFYRDKLEKGEIMEILIRHAEPDDYQAIAKIYQMPKAVWGTLQLPLSPARLWQKRLAEPAEGTYHLLACVDGEVVGQLGLHTAPNSPRRRHVGQIGMAVRDDWHGKGIGTALMQAMIDLADKWLNLRRIELEVYTDNEAAIRLYQKFGFTIEGTKLAYAFRDGRYVDTHMMARLRME
jgi:putative acetyltransferase